MADRLKRALDRLKCTCMLAVTAALLPLLAPSAAAERSGPASDVFLVQRRSADAARALGRFYAATNDGAYEAYLTRTLAAHGAVGLSERCRLPSGMASTRPTVLANPPLARTSVEQRRQLLATLGFYEAALVAVAEQLPPAVVAVALGDLHRQLGALGVAANTHAQGDLFIEDATKALAADLERFIAAGDRPAQLRAVDAADAQVRKLASILSTDASRQRGDALDAAALAYRGWIAYDDGARAAGTFARDKAGAALPMCSEPAIYKRGDALVKSDAGDPVPAAGPLGDWRDRARLRLAAVRAANPAAMLTALEALDESELRALRTPQNSDAAAGAKTAPAQFDAAARNFSEPFDRYESD